MTRVLYVAGYGRSGSTVLSALLGTHPQVASVGEVSFLFDEWRTPGRVCSCGQRYTECEFWRELFADGAPADALGRPVRRLEAAPVLPLLGLGWGGREVRQEYREGQRRLFDYVAQRAAAAVVVDSSKSATATAGRFVALHRIAGLEVYVLHLVRDGRTSLRTHAQMGSNWALEGHGAPRRLAAVRALAGWLWVNSCVSLLGRRLGPGRYLRVRYEDLLTDPEAALRRIAAFVGLDAAPLAGRAGHDAAFGFGHMVGGNRVRLQGAARLWRPGDAGAPTPAPAAAGLRRRDALLFAALGGWLNRRYGYRPAPEG